MRRTGIVWTLLLTGVVLTACTDGDQASTGVATSDAIAGDGADEAATPDAPSGPYVLDLRTGEVTPLPASLAEGWSYSASPDASMIAYSTRRDGHDTIVVADADGSDERTSVVPDGLTASGASWAPDGTKLAFQLVDPSVAHSIGNLFVYDLTTDRWSQLTEFGLKQAFNSDIRFTFSPDGSELLFHLPRSPAEDTSWDVWSVPVTGGRPTQVLANAASPSVAAGSQELAFVVPHPSAWEAPRIAFVHSDGSGQRHTLIEASDSIWYFNASPDGSRIVYNDGEVTLLHDSSTGETSQLQVDGTARWFGNDALLVEP